MLREVVASGATSVTWVLEAATPGGQLGVYDTQSVDYPECVGRLGPTLEVATELRGLLAGRELLTRATDTSALLSMWAVADVEVAVDVGPSPDALVPGAFAMYPAHTAIRIPLTDLPAGQRSHYRTRLRRPSSEAVELGPVHTVHTQRAPGDPFTFTLSTDAHFLQLERRRAHAFMALLQVTAGNIAADAPDLHLDLGDTFSSESYRSYDAPERAEVLRRHLAVRPFFDGFAGSAPLYLALGNHEGEQGWRLDAGDPLVSWATDVRRTLYPMPTPGAFYRGNPAPDSPQNYYAFEWGDALLVVLDPYRYTQVKPHDHGFVDGSDDTWDWTLGEAQYRWLQRTLAGSERTFKFVLAHQVAGGTNSYGRGGRLAAVHAPKRAAPGSFEWGGEDLEGGDAFAAHRPGWDKPVHALLAEHGVTAFIHGHDHVFAVEPHLDGVTYVSAPQPANGRYDLGHSARAGLMPKAVKIANSGHLRVAVSPTEVRLEYVRAYLLDDGPNGEVAHTVWFTDCDRNGVADAHDAGGAHHDSGCAPTR